MKRVRDTLQCKIIIVLNVKVRIKEQSNTSLDSIRSNIFFKFEKRYIIVKTVEHKNTNQSEESVI